jgi:hypothetical protein
MIETYSPALRISCRESKTIKIGNSVLAGVLISGEDFRTLRLLTKRDIRVMFVCDGRPVYEGQVKALVQRGIYLQDLAQWYLPTTATGPLKPARLLPIAD